MKKIIIIITILAALAFSGCITDDPDVRPPLMDTSLFTNFVPNNVSTN